MELIKAEVRRIEKVLPQEAAAVNVMKHILKLIRDEYITGFKVRLIIFVIINLNLIFVLE